MTSSKPGRRLRVLSVPGGIAGLVLLMLYMSGTFSQDKIRPGKNEAPQGAVGPARTAKASAEKVTEFYECVGTVRPKMETGVESQVMAKVLDVYVRPGTRVTKGQPLLRLDSREYEARLEQARQALLSARSRREQMEQARIASRAELDRAEAAFRRTKTYFDQKAATAQDMEQAEAAFRQARARLEQAEKATTEADAGVRQSSKAIEEAQIFLGYTRVNAPEEGEVVRRLVEPGDLAAPGRPLLMLQTRGKLRLEAFIPESMIGKIRLGSALQVKIDAVGRLAAGSVEEVVPSADPMTRTFLAKVALPEREDVFPGMFGRLLIPVGERSVVLIPKNALTRIGQLEVVKAELGGRWQHIFVTTGEEIGDKVEVLSGLKGDETLALEGEGHVL